MPRVQEAAAEGDLMRNNNLIQRQKRHAAAYMRIYQQGGGPVGITNEAAVKALHHVQRAHIAWRARHEFQRRPREKR